MAELRSGYLGLELRNPVIASAGPLSQSVEDIKALADAGVGAVTMFSLFEEQLLRDAERLVELEEQFADITPEATSFFPEVPRAEADAVTNYLRLVEKGAQAIDVPLIASLNGASRGGWVHSARSLQDAGAAALELNIYYVPGDLTLGGEAVEQRHLDILRAVKSEVSIPVAVKLSPYFSSVGAMCRPARPGRGRWPGVVQPVPAARYRPGSAGGGQRGDAELARGRPPAAHLDRRAARPCRGLARGLVRGGPA